MMRIWSSAGRRFPSGLTAPFLARALSLSLGPPTPSQRPPPSLSAPIYVVEPAQRRGSFRRFLRLAGGELPWLSGAVAGGFLHGAAALAIPAGLGALLDGVAHGGLPLATSAWLLLGFALAAAGHLARRGCLAVATERIRSALRRRLFAALLCRPSLASLASSASPASPDALARRLSQDAAGVAEGLTGAVAGGAQALLRALGGLAGMLWASPLLTAVGGGLLPPLAVFAGVAGRDRRRRQRARLDRLAGMTAATAARLRAVGGLPTLATAAREARWFAGTEAPVLDAGVRVGRWQAGYEALLMLAGYGAAYCVVWAGSLLVASGGLTPGGLLAFVLYALYAGTGLLGLSNVVVDLNRGYGAALGVFEILEAAERHEAAAAGRPPPPLSLPDWTLRFDGVAFASLERPSAMGYRHLDLTIPPSRCTCVVGGRERDSGPSSLALLLLRLLEPTSGRITLGGNNLADLNEDWLRGQIGYVGPGAELLDGSIAQNIAYGFRSHDWEAPIDRWLHAIVVDAATKAHAHDFIAALPEGYDTVVGEHGRSLSAGERQRIAIARALVSDPRILILDEATSMLDSESEAVVHETIAKLIQESNKSGSNRQRTVLIFANRLSTVRRADHIVVLHNGDVAIEGIFEEVGKNDIFRRLMGLEGLNLLEV